MERLRRCALVVSFAVLGASEHADAGDPEQPLPPGCEHWTDGGDVAFFRRDGAKWTSWWRNEAHATLPEQVDAAEAFKSYEAWMQEREEEHQRKMRAK
jgi:hypothetical protein